MTIAILGHPLFSGQAKFIHIDGDSKWYPVLEPYGSPKVDRKSATPTNDGQNIIELLGSAQESYMGEFTQLQVYKPSWPFLWFPSRKKTWDDPLSMRLYNHVTPIYNPWNASIFQAVILTVTSNPRHHRLTSAWTHSSRCRSLSGASLPGIVNSMVSWMFKVYDK